MMAYKHMSDLMDNLKVDLERRYNVKCRFVETTVPNNIRLVCQLIAHPIVIGFLYIVLILLDL